MANLATLEEAKTALNYDGNDFDSKISLYLGPASQVIYEYLKWDEADYEVSGALDETAEGVERAKIATICLVGYMLENPASDEDKAFGHGTLPWFVTAPLYPLRDPTLA